MVEDKNAILPSDGRANCYHGHEVLFGSTIASVHRQALFEFVWNQSHIFTQITEDGEKVMELGPRTYVVKDITQNRYMDILPVSKRFLDEYTNALMNGYREGVNFEYDYHSRLFHYTTDYAIGEANTENQIECIIKKLIKHPNTRRALAITWYPDSDNYFRDCPCLQYIQCRIINDTLHMNVLFRSNDMLSAFGSNAYALTSLQMYITDYISRSINKKLAYGYYNHTAICPHIYYERDAEEYKKVYKYLME